ncbi:hypothetical protein [Flagellimonas flava]|uniref:DUF541 domain-containing protein n=1 Tax=Flagellimonas flava TaxID=570519 RepID=A0A1M5HXV2_9FLAO|nr:hypothetical protein [Allomuricauda flava]SHG20683.1 hypothetical protein SAMN04488116_0278 [Allomuricauda flava]
MKAINKILVGLTLLVVWSASVTAQELKVEAVSSVSIDELPEYVVVTSENTKLIGGININIDYKKSDYEKVLKELESLLQNRKKLRIRNQTDLLNAMSKLGFEYVNAYNGKENNISLGSGKDVEVIGGQAKYRVNMVFKKKEKYQS